MKEIALYLKTKDKLPRPAEEVYYLVTGSGTYLCRNHAFFQSDVPAPRPPQQLEKHRPQCLLKYPRFPAELLEQIIGFFGAVYDRYDSEAIALLLWNLQTECYQVCVPTQVATVWESSGGIRSAMDVHYEVPVPLPPRCLLAASIHSHADGDAYSSWTDRHDEAFRDGVHVVCGRINREPPAFHLEFAVDGCRFQMKFPQFFQGYTRRDPLFPQQWLQQVTCKTMRPGHLVQGNGPQRWENGPRRQSGQ